MGNTGERVEPMATAGIFLILGLLVGLVAILLLRELTTLKSLGAEPRATLILVVRNCEQCIEGVLRPLLGAMGSGAFEEMVVVDENSHDDTPEIAERLLRPHLGTELVRAEGTAGPPGGDHMKPGHKYPLSQVRLIDMRDAREALAVLRAHLAAAFGETGQKTSDPGRN